MTDIPDSQTIQLFSGPESPCGYLPNKESRSVFIDPDIALNNSIFSELGRYGFRRSGNHVYRPQCGSCNACWSYRVLCQEFNPSKSQKRILRSNQGLTQHLELAQATEEDYKIYEKYITMRHKDGEMYPPSFEQYEDFLFSNWCESLLLKLKDKEQTVAVMCLDVLDDGLSAVYSFFDPESEYKSLGTDLVLRSIELVKKHQQSYCYLGYFIQNCQKMSYKRNYKPAEALVSDQWQQVADLLTKEEVKDN